jgi:hypothetical protein
MPPMPPTPAMPSIQIPDIPRSFMTWGSPVLGIESETLNPQLAEYFGVKEGVLVRSVSVNSSAEKAGFKAGRHYQGGWPKGHKSEGNIQHSPGGAFQKNSAGYGYKASEGGSFECDAGGEFLLAGNGN